MMPLESPDNIAKIVAQFRLDEELTLLHSRQIGPDENLYLFGSASGRRYCLWSRDYMGELRHEAQGLKNNQSIIIKNWIPLKESSSNTAPGDKCVHESGISFALGEYS